MYTAESNLLFFQKTLYRLLNSQLQLQSMTLDAFLTTIRTIKKTFLMVSNLQLKNLTSQ